MAKKSKKAHTAGKGGSKKAPSVMGFLQKVGGMPRMGDTPAKGLLGGISREDLVEAGRLNEGGEPRIEEVELAPVATTVEADLSEPQGRWDHLEDIVAEDDVAVSRLKLARQVGAKINRGSADMRTAERRPAQVHVEYRNAGRVEVDLAANLSSGGAFVRTATPLDVGDPMLLSFRLPGRRLPLQVAARVKWVAPFGDRGGARPGMGVEFVALDERARLALETLMRTENESKDA